jgi:hypothetical protein
METRQREKDWLAVAKYMVRRRDRPSPTWRSFLLNQAQGIAAITCLSWLAHRFGCCMSADRKSIARFTLEGLRTAYPYGLMIPQSHTERVLDEFLNSLGVKVERTIELTRFTASNDKVVSTLRHADGAEEIAETSWLIGCEGAHSTVRHQLGRENCGGRWRRELGYPLR